MNFFVMRYILNNTLCTVIVRAESLDSAKALVEEKANASSISFVNLLSESPDTSTKMIIFINK